MSKKQTWVLIAGIIILIIILDQWTKYLAMSHLTLLTDTFGNELTRGILKEVTLIPHFLYFTLHLNDGAAWGSFSGALPFFIIITLLALSVFIFLMKDIDIKHKKFYTFSLPLLIGGTIGNFIDRTTTWLSDRGFVVDMIDVHIIGHNFPVFNVADAALTVGWIMLAIDLIFFDKKRGVQHDNIQG